MPKHSTKLAFLSFATALALSGCATQSTKEMAHFQTGETLVLVGQEPGHLIFQPSDLAAVTVRSTYRADRTNTIRYEAGKDYVVTPAGDIQRTEGSRIRDFKKNFLYGKEDFNHALFPGFGNGDYFVYVDYPHREALVLPKAKPEFSAKALPLTRKKLKSGAALRIVAYGDSITAGGEATEPKLIFWERWADALRAKYPKAQITSINGATGRFYGARLQRLQEKVLSQKADLVLIGFGMNDHNREGYGVPVKAFADNLRSMIDQIRANNGAEVVLFSAFPPNPKWHFGSHNMTAYADVTEQVAREKHCAFADVYRLWQRFAEHKKPEDLLGNNINHPNDFGHWIYFEAFQGLGL